MSDAMSINPEIYCSIHCEITQFAIDTVLRELNFSTTIEKYVEQKRRGFYFKVGGPMTLHNFQMKIVDGKGCPSVEITNEFKLYCRVPVLGERQFESLPFKLSAPSVGVELNARGSKGYASLRLNRLKMELGDPGSMFQTKPRLLEEIWEFLKQSFKIIVEELTLALNERLKQEPFELFDLSRTQIPLGEGEGLDTRILFDRFAFEGDKLIAAVRFLPYTREVARLEGHAV